MSTKINTEIGILGKHKIVLIRIFSFPLTLENLKIYLTFSQIFGKFRTDNGSSCFFRWSISVLLPIILATVTRLLPTDTVVNRLI
jgi:hypothetical protein